MCYIGCVADRYTACQHNLILYETSARTDCGDEHCKTSAAHKHTAIECGCPTYRIPRPSIQNMFRTPCPSCLETMPAPTSGRRR